MLSLVRNLLSCSFYHMLVLFWSHYIYAVNCDFNKTKNCNSFLAGTWWWHCCTSRAMLYLSLSWGSSILCWKVGSLKLMSSNQRLSLYKPLQNQTDTLLTRCILESHCSETDHTCLSTGSARNGHVNWQSVFQNFEISSLFKPAAASSAMRLYPFLVSYICLHCSLYTSEYNAAHYIHPNFSNSLHCSFHSMIHIFVSVSFFCVIRVL